MVRNIFLAITETLEELIFRKNHKILLLFRTSVPQELHLDWRKCPAVEELLARLRGIAQAPDSGEGRIDLILSTSSSRKVVRLHDAVGDEPPMWRQNIVYTARQWPQDPANKRETPTEKYLTWIFNYANQMATRVGQSSAQYNRSLYYQLIDEKLGLTKSKSESILLDIALTGKVHPYCLGLKAEGKSLVVVPQGCKVKLTLVTNLLLWADDQSKTTELTFEHNGGGFLIRSHR
ncbi:hypothetical protein LTR70_007839 [Exophiala xenobiotica]|nr:hypothetical protein LTR70_007839 [Exophiala xenobiotica]